MTSPIRQKRPHPVGNAQSETFDFQTSTRLAGVVANSTRIFSWASMRKLFGVPAECRNEIVAAGNSGRGTGNCNGRSFPPHARATSNAVAMDDSSIGGRSSLAGEADVAVSTPIFVQRPMIQRP